MSYHVRFSMSTGLACPICVPAGTLDAIAMHVVWIESALGLTRERYLDNPWHWANVRVALANVADDAVLCEAVQRHNDWLEALWHTFANPKKPRDPKTETITPQQAAGFWHALEELKVPFQRWTTNYRTRQWQDMVSVMTGTTVNGCTFDARRLSKRQAAQVIVTVPLQITENEDYREEINAYRVSMEQWYEALRGRNGWRPNDKPLLFDAQPLTERQAGAVVLLFSAFLDTHDIRLDVPDGHDYLASYDDGYSWCSTCGKAIAENDVCDRATNCRRKGCEIKAEYQP